MVWKVIAGIFLFCTASSAAASYKTEVYSAYISNNLAKWKRVIDRMESQKSASHELILELVNYQYGYIAVCIGENKNDEARKYLKKAESFLKTLEADSRHQSIVNAYYSAFYGFKIGMSKLSAPFLGPKSLESARESIRLDPGNYFGYVQFGNIQFYMPSTFGGSKKVALENYLKAEMLLEQSPESHKSDWNYLSLLATIAQAYSYVGDLESSVRYCDKVLAIEPDFLWVKNELYPSIKDKIKEQESARPSKEGV